MGININLTQQLEEMVREKVTSGFDNSASEVVWEALRLMVERDRLKSARFEELRRDIRAGLGSGDPTAWDPEQVKRDRQARRKGTTTSVKADNPCRAEPDSSICRQQWAAITTRYAITLAKPVRHRPILGLID